MDYKSALSYIENLDKFGIDLGLERMELCLKALGNPQNNFPCVHVAGTNGKGSTSTLIATALSCSGRKTGLYTSPQLEEFGERIRVDLKKLPREKLAPLLEAVLATIPSNEKLKTLTQFEIITAMAFKHFSDEKVDAAVVEVGMGGRLDATNTMVPAVSVIVNVGLDHSEYLGSSLADIAREKAGIIKSGVPVVSAVKNEALQIVEQRAEALGAPLFVSARAFSITRNVSGKLNYNGRLWRLDDVELGLRGEYQIGNAGLALAALECLSERGLNVDEGAVRQGFKTARWPGRFEIVGAGPRVLLDGAHNPHASKALAQALKEVQRNGKLILVIGMLDDKDARSILADLAPEADCIVLTQSSSHRAFTVGRIQSLVGNFARTEPRLIDNVPDALDFAISTASTEDLICVAGSLTIVGEARSHLRALGWLGKG